jgi:hypothetical protein
MAMGAPESRLMLTTAFEQVLDVTNKRLEASKRLLN